MNALTLCMDCFFLFWCVNSVLGLYLHPRDASLKLNLPFNMCRWLIEGKDIEIVHEVLAKHHLYLTSRPLLRS